MATPYEFLAQQLRNQFPNATVEPVLDKDEYLPRTTDDHFGRTIISEQLTNDYTTLNQHYYEVCPYRYPLQLTHPGHQPIRLRVAGSLDYLRVFTSPDSEIRQQLAHYGYWRIDTPINPITTDFWLLMLYLKDQPAHYLILPTTKLKQLLRRAHNPQKFSLLMDRSGFAFAAQPLTAVTRLAALKNPSLLDTPENGDLLMNAYLNNWQLLDSPPSGAATTDPAFPFYQRSPPTPISHYAQHPMEEVEKYLADINRMWQFIEAFSARASNVFKVKRIMVQENAWVGGPLVCFFFMHAYDEIPPAATVLALAEPMRDFPFELTCEAVEDPGTQFNEFLCYFCLAIDWGRDVYFIRKSDDF